jgi:hypothetical protein
MRAFNAASISDVHMNHPRIPTEGLCDGIKAAFPDCSTTASLDMLYIVGDFFDSAVPFYDDNAHKCIAIIVYILTICKKHNIELLVLEGTPSHDRKQSRWFITINEQMGIGASVRYVENLSIEYYPKWDLNILCIPDKWRRTAIETLEEVDALMKAKGLTYVDVGLIHGQFPHQIPEIVSTDTHDPEAYQAIVKGPILVGHIHIPSNHGRIHAQGSFGRTAHNEEHPKGHLRLFLSDNHQYRVKFVVNRHAVIFKTINVNGLTPEEALVKLSEYVESVPVGSHVRIEAAKGHAIFSEFSHLIRSYPFVIWSKKTTKEEAKPLPIKEQKARGIADALTITPDNINSLISAKLGLDHPNLTGVLALLEEIHNE